MAKKTIRVGKVEHKAAAALLFTAQRYAEEARDLIKQAYAVLGHPEGYLDGDATQDLVWETDRDHDIVAYEQSLTADGYWPTGKR